jgi:hypothetical protein
MVAGGKQKNKLINLRSLRNVGNLKWKQIRLVGEEIMDVKFIVEHDGDTKAFHGLCDRQLEVGENVVDVVEPRYAWAYPSFKSGSKIRPNSSRYL